jgi:reactive intermediate/imine deaminase
MKTGKTAILCLSLLAALASAGLAAQENRAYTDARSAGDEGVPPFSCAVATGNTLYVSGHIGLVGDKVPDNASDEARAVMDAVKATVEKAGFTMDDIVQLQIFCSDVSHYAAFNEVYRTYFRKEYPARAFVGSGKLLFDARFEVLAIAVRR